MFDIIWHLFKSLFTSNPNTIILNKDAFFNVENRQEIRDWCYHQENMGFKIVGLKRALLAADKHWETEAITSGIRDEIDKEVEEFEHDNSVCTNSNDYSVVLEDLMLAQQIDSLEIFDTKYWEDKLNAS